jgi:hypothetical protein
MSQSATIVDTSQAIDLKLNHGLTYEQIAAIQGTSKQNIHRKIKHLLPTKETDEYKNNRADILAHTQLRLIKALTDDKIKKMQPRDIIVSYGILYDKERLERGESTENVSIITQAISDLQAKRQAKQVSNDAE